MFEIYLYLTKRDKKGMRIIAKFLSKEQSAIRITEENITNLSIPINILNDINKKIYDSRMMWEVWAETSDSYLSLKKLLKKRGYKNIPMSAQPEIMTLTIELDNRLENKKPMIQKLADHNM